MIREHNPTAYSHAGETEELQAAERVATEKRSELATDAAKRQALGSDIEIDVLPIDETNTRVRSKEIIAEMARYGGFGLVGLVGVQSNQS